MPVLHYLLFLLYLLRRRSLPPGVIEVLGHSICCLLVVFTRVLVDLANRDTAMVISGRVVTAAYTREPVFL
jgi:hypothetical protein